MKIPVSHKSDQGQTSLEYLLLLAVVAVVVIASFSPHSLVDQIHDAAGGYYNNVTEVIMGNGNEASNGKQVNPIDGHWCPVTCPPSGTIGPTTIYRSCECPAPAFGGIYCVGDGSVDCAAQGVKPVPAAHVGCPNNMYFDTTPTTPYYNQCACIAGTSWNGSACVSGNSTGDVAPTHP